MKSLLESIEEMLQLYYIHSDDISESNIQAYNTVETILKGLNIQWEVN